MIIEKKFAHKLVSNLQFPEYKSAALTIELFVLWRLLDFLTLLHLQPAIKHKLITVLIYCDKLEVEDDGFMVLHSGNFDVSSPRRVINVTDRRMENA